MPSQAETLWVDNSLARERTERLQKEMQKQGMGGLLCSQPENIQYVSNVKVLAAKAFVPAEGCPLLIIRPRDVGYVQKAYPHVRLGPVAPGGVRSPSGVKFSLSLLDELVGGYGLRREDVGFDELDIDSVRSLTAEGISVPDGRPAIAASRSLKTPSEVDIYRRMVRNYGPVMEAVRHALRPGMSEQEIGAVAAMAWYKLGGEDIEDLEICAGERMNPWHRWPTPRKVSAGELLGVDFHGIGDGGLIADLSRTFYLDRKAPGEIEDLYKRAKDYLLEAVDTLKAGRTLGDVLERVPKVPEKYAEQLYNYNIVHSVGMAFGGSPELNKATARLDTTLEVNHVLTVESYFAEVGSPLAVKLERMLVVTNGAPEILDLDVSLDDWRVA